MIRRYTRQGMSVGSGNARWREAYEKQELQWDTCLARLAQQQQIYMYEYIRLTTFVVELSRGYRAGAH